MALRSSLLLIIMVLVQWAHAQYTYLVYFKDKVGSRYTIDKPDQFLSPRSILRRQRQGIEIRASDLPVNSAFTDSLVKLGADVWYTSKWLNAAYIKCDQTFVSPLSNLGFVAGIKVLKTQSDQQGDSNTAGKKSKKQDKMAVSTSDYGLSYNQAKMICADEMHSQGYKGNDILIAVCDGGFRNANTQYYFQHLFESGRIMGTYDFVSKNSDVYDNSNHGTQALSCIAGYAQGRLIGTAPQASFYLFRTEDEGSEYLVEEVNWVIAAEKADSLGVDIISTSLGYTTFDDRSMDHSYTQLDGKTTIISKAATVAASVGMICVVSAGNNGNDSWKYVSAPADADSILAVGAVDANQNPSGFSAYGPTFDKRVKPDVSAQGSNAVLGSADALTGQITVSSGTSFSAPIITGLVAGIWQAFPNFTNLQIIDLVKKSATQYANPDTRLGYGIPCFQKAQQIAFGKSGLVINDQYLFPNPFTEGPLLLILNQNDIAEDVSVAIFDSSGKQIHFQSFNPAQLTNTLSISSKALTAGLYFVKITGADFSKIIRLVKN